MTLNLGSILNLKHELEYKLKKKVYEERSRAEEKSKYLTSMAFTELLAFFDKMHKFSLESDFDASEAESAFTESFVGKQFSMAAIKMSEMLSRIRAKQQEKINEYLSKKVEIEDKISELKDKIAGREAKLSELESKITTIESKASTGDEAAINLLNNEIKELQGELEKTHAETVDDLVKQKELSQTIKAVASEVVKEETEKVVEVINEHKKTNKQPVDTETQQLVFEFAKETKKAIEETGTTANIDDKHVEEMKEVKTEGEKNDEEANNPQQLELPFAEPEPEVQVPDPDPAVPAVPEPVQQQDPVAPVEGAPGTPEEVTNETSGEDLIKTNEDDTTTKQNNDQVDKAVDAMATEAGLNTEEIKQAAHQEIQEEREKVSDDTVEETTTADTPAETTPAVTTPAAPVTTPAAATTPEAQAEATKKKIDESTEKVKKVKETSTEITENVDKKLAELQNGLLESQEKLVESKTTMEDKPAEDVAAQPPENQTGPQQPNQPQDPAAPVPIVAEPEAAPETAEDKKAKVETATQSLKESAGKQKEILQVQKETVKALEESAKKLIEEVVLGDVAVDDTAETEVVAAVGTVAGTVAAGTAPAATVDPEAEKANTVSIENLKEMLEEAYEDLQELMQSMAEAISVKKNAKNTDKMLTYDDKDLLSEGDLNHLEISKLKKKAEGTDEELKKVKTEVFYISGEMKSVDKVLEKCKEIAAKSEKIVLDKELSGIYKKLTDELGEDKVVLDRRGGDRRTGDRRTDSDRRDSNVFGANKEEIKKLENLNTKKIDTSLSDDRRLDSERRDASDRRGSDRRQADTNFIFDMDELDLILQMKNNKMA